MSTSSTAWKTENHSFTTVVIGFGNLLLKDEGVGIHIIQALDGLSRECGGELKIIDGATCPDVLYLLPEGVDKLIIVDAVQGGGKPGYIYRFTPDDLTFSEKIPTSAHQLGLAEGLRGLKLLGLAPKEIIIIGVEPKVVDWGLDVSSELKEILPHLVNLVKKEIFD